MRRLSITWRMVLLAVTPAVVMGLALSFWFTRVRGDELEIALRERSHVLVQRLAAAVDPLLAQSGNAKALQALAEVTRAQPDVSLVMIVDGAGHIIGESGDREAWQGRLPARSERRPVQIEQPDFIFVTAPLRPAAVEPSAADAGWVGVVSSKATLIQRHDDFVRIMVVFALGAGALALLLAWRVGRGIARPLRSVTTAVDRITQGDLSTRIDWTPGSELATLARSVNAMTMSLRASQEELHDSIKAATRQLSYQASHDTLTGLINRREFETRLERALYSARQHDSVHALCFIDVDQFKIVNDTCGHNAGDELLRQIAEQLRQKIRERDTLARIGGDEFTVLLENCYLEDAYEVASQLREALQNMRFAWQEKSFTVGASIGVVVIDKLSESVATLLSHADAACYTAKDLGRNRVFIYNEDDEVRSSRIGAMEWVTQLNMAMEEDRLVLYCQRIQPLQSVGRESDHYEILLRMHGDNGEVILPMAFIPAAERYNLMQVIDRWVVSHSLALMRRLIDARPNGRRNTFSINLSGATLCDDKFFQFLQDQLALHAVPPEDVCFEITETAAVTNLVHATSLMQRFRKLGCRFVLDDFGAGLSSFTYLKHLPVDGIKMDGAFIRGICTNAIDASMVQAINDIGHVMGLTTTAEFVEDADIMDKLIAMGVDYGQGNSVQMPCPAEEWFAAILDQPAVPASRPRQAVSRASER